jgi:hypothetical protein
MYFRGLQKVGRMTICDVGVKFKCDLNELK